MSEYQPADAVCSCVCACALMTTMLADFRSQVDVLSFLRMSEKWPKIGQMLFWVYVKHCMT